MYAGIEISGTNAEVMPAQWEFQVCIQRLRAGNSQRSIKPAAALGFPAAGRRACAARCWRLAMQDVHVASRTMLLLVAGRPLHWH